MSFTLPSQEDKAEYVLRQFDRIAANYDLTNNAISMGMHRYWKKRAIAEMDVRKGAKYLDVCCGTGDLTLMLAEKLDRPSEVTGLDFSPNMLKVAKQRLNKSKDNTSAQFVQGDALNLPFPDGTFDGAIISFGLRNLTSFAGGIEQMKRVVKPGGKVVNLDLGRSSVPVFSQVFALYFRYVVPVIGQVLQSDKQAYTYLPVSMTAYPAPDGITELFQKAGLIEVKHIALALGTVALHVGTVPE